MTTGVLALLLLVAVAAACIAVARARAAQAQLGASLARDRDRVELDQKTQADGRLARDISHDLNDLLTAIIGHTELLIASLDPDGGSILDAYEIRRAALSAAQLTRPLRTLGGSGAADAGGAFAVEAQSRLEPAVAVAPVVDTRVRPQVLVVEDEPGMRELIRVVLTKAGYRVVAVDAPRAALAALARQPDMALMLVDVVMPEMNGYDMVAEARTSVAGIQVVFISAFARDPARTLNADRFLAKPFTAEALTAVVEAALADQNILR
ncbi:MAG: hybrid sensor histidine kinase/response regulator [Acidobacteria bacterium]|nr:hybrid sensor histidine kinase/response regulator [Acidobacteriota bacterium]